MSANQTSADADLNVEFQTADGVDVDAIVSGLPTSKVLARRVRSLLTHVADLPGHEYSGRVEHDADTGLTFVHVRPARSHAWTVKGHNTTTGVFVCLGVRGGVRSLELRDDFSGWGADYADQRRAWSTFMSRLRSMGDSPKPDAETDDDDDSDDQETDADADDSPTVMTDGGQDVDESPDSSASQTTSDDRDQDAIVTANVDRLRNATKATVAYESARSGNAKRVCGIVDRVSVDATNRVRVVLLDGDREVIAKFGGRNGFDSFAASNTDQRYTGLGDLRGVWVGDTTMEPRANHYPDPTDALVFHRSQPDTDGFTPAAGYQGADGDADDESDANDSGALPGGYTVQDVLDDDMSGWTRHDVQVALGKYFGNLPDLYANDSILRAGLDDVRVPKTFRQYLRDAADGRATDANDDTDADVFDYLPDGVTVADVLAGDVDVDDLDDDQRDRLADDLADDSDDGPTSLTDDPPSFDDVFGDTDLGDQVADAQADADGDETDADADAGQDTPDESDDDSGDDADADGDTRTRHPNAPPNPLGNAHVHHQIKVTGTTDDDGRGIALTDDIDSVERRGDVTVVTTANGARLWWVDGNDRGSAKLVNGKTGRFDDVEVSASGDTDDLGDLFG